MANPEILYWTALNMVPGLGPIKISALMEICDYRPAEIFRKSRDRSLPLHKSLNARDRSELSGFNLEEAEKEIRRAEKQAIKIITLADGEYPSNLRHIPDPPPVLYLSGTLESADDFALGIVGCRLPSPYGIVQAERFAAALSAEGMTIVSGLARGIDSAAHRGTLRAGGRTLAVLGSGLMSIYPPENRALAEKITSSGALISEYPLLRKPDRTTFPRRNRIVSGLCPGLLVVEAGPRSGSLITAALALDQGREVFALPGPVDSETSSGTNSLISQGAQPALSPGDIALSLSGFHPGDRKAEKARKEENETPAKNTGAGTGQEEKGPGEKKPAGAREKITAFLEGRSESSAEEIAEKIRVPLHETVATLSRMEIEGTVARKAGGNFCPVDDKQ